MKILTSLPIIAAITVVTTGCFTYERREVVPARTTVVETMPAPVVGRETVVTTLPVGYTTRVVKGSRYYYYNNTFYRTYPRGGYVVVTP